MKKIYVTEISDYEFRNIFCFGKDDFSHDTEEIETEDDWNYGDVVKNGSAGYENMDAQVVYTDSNFIVWKITSFVDDEYCSYVVELL